jgi:hypothetical protein
LFNIQIAAEWTQRYATEAAIGSHNVGMPFAIEVSPVKPSGLPIKIFAKIYDPNGKELFSNIFCIFRVCHSRFLSACQTI